MGRTDIVAGVLLSVAACDGSNLDMKGSKEVPAAQAELNIEREEGNTGLAVQAKHLAPANKVRNDAQAYVVWVEPLSGQEPPQNVGALQLDDELEGELQTVTPHEKFRVFITPESDPNAERPTGPQVLAQVVQ